MFTNIQQHCMRKGSLKTAPIIRASYSGTLYNIGETLPVISKVRQWKEIRAGSFLKFFFKSITANNISWDIGRGVRKQFFELLQSHLFITPLFFPCCFHSWKHSILNGFFDQKSVYKSWSAKRHRDFMKYTMSKHKKCIIMRAKKLKSLPCLTYSMNSSNCLKLLCWI